MSMDSATSESFQSSNNGNDLDDLDSRTFLNLPPPIHHTSRSIFDPFPSFISDLDPPSWPPPQTLPPPPPTASLAAPRPSKKRARASRRAPTTVLTTDTSNFRAMVQEFTGIPAPPFPSSSVFSRPRLDLFHHAASAASTPGFLLRPFAQKRPTAGVLGSITTAIPSTTMPSTSGGSQNQNFLLNNPIPSLNFQSMIQEQQRALGLCPWAGGGYEGGELGSVIAGAVEADLNKVGSCKTDHTRPSSSSEMPTPTAAPQPAAATRGEGGMDIWQLSSD